MKKNLDQSSVSPPSFRTNGVSICGYLFLCLNMVLFKYLPAIDWSNFLKLTAEGSLVETLTIVWLLLGGGLLFATALVERRASQRLVYVLGCIALLFGAGEEGNWGQRIFNYSTPDILFAINSQGEFNVHNTALLDSFHHGALEYGTWVVCVTTVVALLCRRSDVFGIRLPSILLPFGLLAVLFSMPPLSFAEWLFKETGAIWLLLIFSLLSRQHELFLVVVTILITATTALIVNWADILAVHQTRQSEVVEYLIAFGCFWYSGELFQAQKQILQNRERRFSGLRRPWADRLIVQWKRWLATWVQPGVLSLFSSRLMASSLGSPLRTTCLFIICVTAGLGSLAYNEAIHQKEIIYNSEKQVISSEPIIRSYWNVYMHKDQLIYSKMDCRPKDTRHPFFLRVTPVAHREVLPYHSFFDFKENGGTIYRAQGPITNRTESCLMSIPLPKYEIARAQTGQWRQWGGVWPSEINDYEVIYSTIVSEEPSIRSNFDIYLSGNILTYIKEPCTVLDTEAWFFLHIYPTDIRNLPFWSKEYGFDNRDFLFADHGKLFDDKCIAAVSLPAYDISRIASGQYTHESRLWEVEFPFR